MPEDKMPEDKNDLQKYIEEASRQSENQELVRTYKLSQKNIATAAILSFIFPIGGYAYTARWKAFGVLLGIFVGILTISTINEQDEEKVSEITTVMGVIMSVSGAFENSMSIQLAREKINKMK